MRHDYRFAYVYYNGYAANDQLKKVLLEHANLVFLAKKNNATIKYVMMYDVTDNIMIEESNKQPLA